MNIDKEIIEPVKPESMYSKEEIKLLSRCNLLEDKIKNLEKTRDDFIKLWEMDKETLEYNNKTLDILTRKTFLEIWLDNNKHTFKLILAILFSPTLLYIAHFIISLFEQKAPL